MRVILVLNSHPISQALAENSRRAILEHLRFGQRTVSELVEATGLKQPNVSNHLAKLRENGLVRSERSGRMVYYSLATPIADVLFRLDEYTQETINRSLAPPSLNHVIGHGAVDLPFQEWRQLYLQAMLAGDEDRSVGIVNLMLERKAKLKDIYMLVFQPALNEIGALYEKGLTDEAQEHLATELTERMMSRVAQFYTPVVKLNRRAVLGCVAGNWHTLGLRMVGDALRELGWDSIFLGANVPARGFVNMVRNVNPHLVVVSCAQEEQEAELRNLLLQLQTLQASPESAFRVAVGGYTINHHPEHSLTLPADFFPEDLVHFLSELPKQVEALKLS